MTGRARLRAGTAQRDAGFPRCTKIQPVDGPGFGVGTQIGGKILQGTSTQHDLLGAKLDLRRDRRLRGRRDQRAQRRHQPDRIGGVIVLGGKLVGVELARGKYSMKHRRGAEANIALAGKFQRRLIGAIAGFKLLELGRGRIGLDPGRYSPRRRRDFVAGAVRPAALGPAEAASVTAPSKRGARASKLSTPSRSPDKRALARIDVEMNPGAVTVSALPG